MSSKKKVLKKEYGTAAATKPGLHKKAPAKRVPMSKARASTQEPSKSTGGEAAGEGQKKKERKRGRWCKKVDPMAEFERHSSDEEEEEEEDVAPAPKSQKLMGDAIKSGATPSKPKTSPKLLLKLKRLQSPRGALGTFQLRRRTRPQCLRWKKKMLKRKC